MKLIIRKYVSQFPQMNAQLAIFILGCLFFSIGAKFFIDSKLGVDPLDVLCIGLTKQLPITIGIASGIVALFFLSIWTFWNKQWPPISPFFTTFFVGNLIDLWNWLHLENLTAFLPRYTVLALGVFICSYASALIIMSGIGIRIMDLVAITIVNRWRWQFISAKMFLEIAMFLIGWSLGGPVGIGTLVFLAVVGTLIQPLIWLNSTYFAMSNFGLPRVVQEP